MADGSQQLAQGHLTGQALAHDDEVDEHADGGIETGVGPASKGRDQGQVVALGEGSQHRQESAEIQTVETDPGAFGQGAQVRGLGAIQAGRRDSDRPGRGSQGARRLGRQILQEGAPPAATAGGPGTAQELRLPMGEVERIAAGRLGQRGAAQGVGVKIAQLAHHDRGGEPVETGVVDDPTQVARLPALDQGEADRPAGPQVERLGDPPSHQTRESLGRQSAGVEHRQNRRLGRQHPLLQLIADLDQGGTQRGVAQEQQLHGALQVGAAPGSAQGQRTG